MSVTETNARSFVESTRTGYAYPDDLARFVWEHWEDYPDGVEKPGHERTESPEEAVLETLFSTCYQAGLLREEERPVTFRAILAPPEEFSEEDGPPYGLHRMEFGEPRPLNERELRRLSPAVNYERSLIGVCRDDDGELKIWGVVHSGSRWLRVLRGGRERSAPLPSVPVVKVEGPGCLAVKKGSEFDAELSGGRIVGSRSDVFTSRWLRDFFTPTQDELRELHEEARQEAEELGETWAPLDPEFPREIARQMYRRLVFTLSEARHGGTIIMVPPERAGEVMAGKHVTLKHTFADGEPRRRLKTLIVGITNQLARTHGRGEEAAYPRTVGWEEYAWSEDRELAELDEAVFEFAHLVAGFAAVDGAVVMTHRGELLGFGGEISGEITPVLSVDKALDPEGESTVREGAEDVGTRHRSAYRLAGALPDALLVVVSQDGNARFVVGRDGMVTCWDQA
jgi:hypothetical protein